MSKFTAVLKTIRAHKKFLVTAHHNPDADALASALAMTLFLKKLGKKVVLVNEDACPSWLEFLPKTNLFKKAKQIKSVDYDVAVILDCGDFGRIGEVERFLVKGKPVINIDHHVTNDSFGSVNVVDAKASSTCEMIYDLLEEARHTVNKDTAALLYAGIMTDTGSFRYENTSPRTHEIAAQLMKHKISAATMYNRLYVGVPLVDMKLFIETIYRAELLQGGKIYCVTLTAMQMRAFSKGFDLKEKLFGFLRFIEGIEVVVILTELKSQEVRVNLRSQGDFDVARLAQQFDGGGHKKAAGCKVYATLLKSKAKVLAAIKKAL